MTVLSEHRSIAEDLVTCTRLLAHYKFIDHSGHISVRLPGTDLILIQPRELSRAALTATALLVVDLEGAVVEGDGIPPAETAIHTGIYRHRHDVGAVAHGHAGDSVVYSVVDQPLLPVRHFFFEFPDGVPVHPDSTHIRAREQGDAVAATLGAGNACLLRAHGSVVVASDIAELFMDCLDLEENARTLTTALQLGSPSVIGPDEAHDLAASYARNGFRARKTWAHHQETGRLAGVL
jgi:ribulose-5-phosphate 4-epimerase/fuculose-1-phosphate aldolase